MKKLALLVSLFLVVDYHQANSQSYFKNDYPEVWERSTNYTLAVAEAMPESMYDYKPGDISLDFREQMHHLIGNIRYISGKITGDQITFETVLENADKETTIAGLREAFYFVSRLIAEVDEPTLKEKVTFAGQEVSKENLMYLIRNHMTHHRAQAILYMRLNDIEPPKYVGW